MAEENTSVPPKVNPLGPRPSTLKLKPILRPTVGGLKTGLKLPQKPGAAPAAKPEATTQAGVKSQTSSMDQLRNVTQNLKSITAPIPQQAILHKTGIIADPGLTESQMAAAKARTSRISLSDAMGVAPVKNEPTPMKTIRIKRPVDIPGATEFVTTSEIQAAAVPPPVQEEKAPEASDDASTSVTQRKTLKISRPGGAVRPAGKFGAKKPGVTQATTVMKKVPTAEGANAEVADMPAETTAPVAGSLAAAAGIKAGANVEKDVPGGVAIMGLLVQAAACVVMGFLAYKLYLDTTISPF